jgi:hypothetical protein
MHPCDTSELGAEIVFGGQGKARPDGIVYVGGGETSAFADPTVVYLAHAAPPPAPQAGSYMGLGLDRGCARS